MTTEENKAYYSNLLIAQYSTMTKARETIALLAGEAIAEQLFTRTRDGFNLDTAVGKQLDVLGALVGVTRYIHGLNPKAYFGMPQVLLSPTPDDPNDFHGFSTQAAPDTAWYFLRYQDYNSPLGTLSDGDFRRLIKYVIGLNHMDVTLENVDALLFEHFGTTIIMTDNEDMTVTYTIAANTDQVITAITLLGALPKPAGVGIIVA